MRGAGHKPHIRKIPPQEIGKLVEDMNRVGFGVVPDYLELEPLRELQQFVEAAVAAARGEYVVFTGEEAFAGFVSALQTAEPTPAQTQYRREASCCYY